jgi:hypothetical protein
MEKPGGSPRRDLPHDEDEWRFKVYEIKKGMDGGADLLGGDRLSSSV